MIPVLKKGVKAYCRHETYVHVDSVKQNNTAIVSYVSIQGEPVTEEVSTIDLVPVLAVRNVLTLRGFKPVVDPYRVEFDQ